jgi:hypothetical protein
MPEQPDLRRDYYPLIPDESHIGIVRLPTSLDVEDDWRDEVPEHFIDYGDDEDQALDDAAREAIQEEQRAAIRELQEELAAYRREADRLTWVRCGCGRMLREHRRGPAGSWMRYCPEHGEDYRQVGDGE